MAGQARGDTGKAAGNEVVERGAHRRHGRGRARRPIGERLRCGHFRPLSPPPPASPGRCPGRSVSRPPRGAPPTKRSGAARACVRVRACVLRATDVRPASADMSADAIERSAQSARHGAPPGWAEGRRKGTACIRTLGDPQRGGDRHAQTYACRRTVRSVSVLLCTHHARRPQRAGAGARTEGGHTAAARTDTGRPMRGAICCAARVSRSTDDRRVASYDPRRPLIGHGHGALCAVRSVQPQGPHDRRAQAKAAQRLRTQVPATLHAPSEPFAPCTVQIHSGCCCGRLAHASPHGFAPCGRQAGHEARWTTLRTDARFQRSRQRRARAVVCGSGNRADAIALRCSGTGIAQRRTEHERAFVLGLPGGRRRAQHCGGLMRRHRTTPVPLCRRIRRRPAVPAAAAAPAAGCAWPWTCGAGCKAQCPTRAPQTAPVH